MTLLRALGAVITAGLLTAGCASSTVATNGLTTVAAADDEDFDCGKLTGKMQIRIMELRSGAGAQETSGIAKGLQSIFKPMMSSGPSTDLDERRANDLNQLKEDNAKLIANDCPAFDLDKELAARPSAPTPQTIPREKAKKN